MTDLPRAWTLTIPLPTFTVNGTRQLHHHALAKLVREYRGTTKMLARAARIPHLDRIAIEATPFGLQIRQDTGACTPATKAAIDGLRDARIIDDDTPAIVCTITHHAPRRGPAGLHLLIVDLADLAPDHGTYAAKLALDA